MHDIQRSHKGKQINHSREIKPVKENVSEFLRKGDNRIEPVQPHGEGINRIEPPHPQKIWVR